MIVLERFCWTPDATFGRLYIAGGESLVTVERPWLGNLPNVSCIPEGRYLVTPGNFKGLYPDLEVQDVPGRTAIEIHIANRSSELRGCIAPGLSLGYVEGDWAVTASKQALERLIDSTDGGHEMLWITHIDEKETR